MKHLQMGRRRAQSGVSLIFALLGLVVLTLGAVALVRSIDTGLLALGNLGFKQDATSASSRGVEAAIAWLQTADTATLEKGDTGKGYSAVAITSLEAGGPRQGVDVKVNAVLIDWLGNDCAVPGLNGRKVDPCHKSAVEIPSFGGNKTKYFITRMCASAGSVGASNDCLQPVSLSAKGHSVQRGAVAYGSYLRTAPVVEAVYYRVFTRTEGARGTVTYSETLVHF